MRISRDTPPPPPPPPEFTMTFTANEGRAIAMALRDAYVKYPKAVDRDKWLRWSKELETELGQA